LAELGPEWWKIVTGLILLGVGTLVSAISFILGRLYERMKPVRFEVCDWKIQFVDMNQPNGTDFSDLQKVGRDKVDHIRFDLVILVFNMKANPVSLRGIELHFKQGTSRQSKTLCTPDEFRYKIGKMYTSVGETPEHYIDLEPHKSTSVTMWGTLAKKDLDAFLKCRSVWLMARSTEGRRKRRYWRIQQLKK